MTGREGDGREGKGREGKGGDRKGEEGSGREGRGEKWIDRLSEILNTPLLAGWLSVTVGIVSKTNKPIFFRLSGSPNI